MQENKIIRESYWCEGTSFLIKKWDRICLQRKHMHNKAANTYDLKNKFLSIPIIFISTILGSLSFISSAGTSGSSSSRMLASRDLQSALPACVCFSYLNGASSSDSDLCLKGTECYPPNAGDGLCPSDMTACVNMFASDAPTDIPTEAPTANCVWELYDEDDISSEYPYCDQSIVRHEDDVFRSSLASVEARFCDRTVDFVTNTGYYQLPIPAAITSQDSLEAWCLEYDEGYGIFYQQYNVDGTNMCCVLTGDADTAIQHGHALGGVCVPAGHFDSPSKIYIQRCGSLSRELCAWDEADAENVGKYPDCPGAMINVNPDTQESSKYYFKTLSQCKSLCESANDCNVVSRYSGKEDTEVWHCYFYNCPTFSDLIWVDQTNWGNGANGAQAYLLQCPDPPDQETESPTGAPCPNNCCISGPDMWIQEASPTIPGWTLESPYLDHTNGGIGKKNQCEDMCCADPQCNSWMWRTSASTCYLSTHAELKEYLPNPGYNDHHPHEFWRGSITTPTFSPTKTPTTFAPSNPAERCENYCQNSCAQFGSPEDNVSECQGCGDSKACHPGASNYNNVVAWCTFYACDSVNSRCDNSRCTQPSNTPTVTKTPTTTPTTSPTPPFEGKSGKSGDSEGDGDGDGSGEECAPGCPDGWTGDGVCDDSCFNSACNYDDGDCPTISPTNLPTTSSPTPEPTKQPTPDPTKQPTPDPTKQPTPDPTKHPTPDPTKHPTPAPTHSCPPTSSYNEDVDDNSSSVYRIFPYIIGAFNMFVAILSALHSFLKYDALEDRHRQYSRHFGALQLDLEALMAKPASQRGDPGTMLERYKTKYAVLINNAPALPEHMERICCISDSDPTQISTIELTTI